MAVRVTGLGLAFLSHIMLSRLLGANDYGHYVIALGWAMVLVIPARLGLDNSVLRYATIYREEGKVADLRGLIAFSLAVISIVSLAIAAILLIGSSMGIGLLWSVEPKLLAGIAMLIPASALLGWMSSLVRTADRIFAAQFYEQALRPALLIVALGGFALWNGPVAASHAMLLTAATVGVALVGLALQCRRAFGGARNIAASFTHRREWLAVSWMLFMMAVVQELLNQIDIIMLGILADATAAAHFSAAWRLASLVNFGLVAIVTVSGPLIASAHHRGNLAELSRIARLNARFSTLFALAIGSLLVLTGWWLLKLFGPGFQAAYPALLILLAGALVNSFTASAGYLLIMTGRQAVAFGFMVMGLAISVSVNLLLIPTLGATGSAVASALALSSWNLAMAIYIRREIGVDATVIGSSPRPFS